MKKLNLVRTIILAASLLLQLSRLCFHSRGAAGDVDLSFDPGSGVNGTVNAVVVQPDGKVVIAGQFTTVKGLARTNLARLNADGSGDATFIPIRAYNPVAALALQPDGKVLAGGQFLEICYDWGCSYPTAVVRLNANGSLDNSFNPAIAENLPDFAEFGSLVVQPDSKVLIGGVFSTVNGTNRNGLARLNSNGSLDSTFNPAVGGYPIALQPDGKVLVGGYARLNADGSLDSSFNRTTELGGEYASGVHSIVVQPDGKVLLGGYFANVNGNSIIRLNPDGSLDSTFNSGSGANGVVSSVAVQSDGKVLIGGGFKEVRGTNRNGIARLNADGSLDSSFNPSTDEYGGVNSVIVQSDGKLFISGLFTIVNGTNRNRLARLNADGSLDNGFDPGAVVLSAVHSLCLQPDGKVLIGAALALGGRWFMQPSEVFTFVNGANRYGRARLNGDGSLDSTFMSAHFNPNLAAFIHTEDCVDDPAYGCSQSVFASAVLLQPDGKVLIGGDVETTITGHEVLAFGYRNFLARFNADGSRDLSFDSPPSSSETVSGLAIQPDGKIIVGGTYFSINGTNRNRIARLNANGSLDSSFNPGTGANGSVYSVALQPDGKVLMGGAFTAVNGTNRNRIARLNADGSLDHSFNPATGPNASVSSVVFQPDGKVLIGGSFTTVNGTNRNRIARLNADGGLDTSFNPGTGADGLVRSIALQSDGNVLIGGDFTTVNGEVRPRIARLYGDSPAPSLSIARSNAFVIVSWPVTGLNFQLQENADLSLPNSWSPVAQPAATNAGQISVTVPTTVGRKFFRLNSQ